MAVFVLDRSGKPLMPCSEKRARLLLDRGRARVHRLVPLAIRLLDRRVADCTLQPLRLKLDPGSKTTGIALVRDTATVETTTGESGPGAVVCNLFELMHRGAAIRKALRQRAAFRRRRRSANLRYRAPRFLNRTRTESWLAPSLQHRVDTTLAWVERLRRLAPVTALASELVRFDLQQVQNPEISGVEYQQGTLRGYEVREYLLEKFERTCAYCDAQNVPFNVDHVRPQAGGGSDRVSNLALSCVPCNEAKDDSPVEMFLAHDPERLARIKQQLKTPLRDAAVVNATRWTLVRALRATGLPLETGSGGRTKWNRVRLGIPKTHALDAACVGAVEQVVDWSRPALTIKATGRGAYQRTLLTAHGFPRGYLMRQKRAHGFRTGDLVAATIPAGRHAGQHRGRVAIRTRPSFALQTESGTFDVHARHLRLLQRGDGYGYCSQPLPQPLRGGLSSPRYDGGAVDQQALWSERWVRAKQDC